MHRWIWDVHYPGPTEPASAFFTIRGATPGPWAPPGRYTVRLTVGGHSLTQPLTLKMDPRVKTPTPDLIRQFTMAQQITVAQGQVQQASREGNRMHEQLQSLRAKLVGQEAIANQVETLDRKMTAFTGAAPERNPDSSGVEEPEASGATFRSLAAAWSEVERAVESADAAPTADAVTAFAHDQQLTRKQLARWEEVKLKDLPRLNEMLRQGNLPLVSPADGNN